MQVVAKYTFCAIAEKPPLTDLNRIWLWVFSFTGEVMCQIFVAAS